MFGRRRFAVIAARGCIGGTGTNHQKVHIGDGKQGGLRDIPLVSFRTSRFGKNKV
jgi:hypothetical protein